MNLLHTVLIAVGPLVVFGGVGAFARWSVYRHAERYAAAIRRRPAPERQKAGVR